MRMIASMLTSAAVAGFSATLGAQPQKPIAPKKTEAPDRSGCVTTNGRTECRFTRFGNDSVMMNRAAIGVQLSPTGTPRDTLGVFVSRVTPKGPAENAGVVEGDRLISINGVDLRVNAADAGDSYAAGLPSRRLTREVGKLSPGGVATLRVYSGGRVRDVQVTAGKASDLQEGGMFGARSLPNMEMLRGPMQRMRMEELPRMKMELPRMMEQMEFPKMRFEDMEFPRMRIESFPRIKDGTRLRITSPRGSGETRTYIITPDGELRLEPSVISNELKEKSEKDKVKK